MQTYARASAFKPVGLVVSFSPPPLSAPYDGVISTGTINYAGQVF